MKNRVLAFRLFARAAGSLHFFVRSQHQLCPCLIFGLLHPDSRHCVAAQIDSMPPCTHDPFVHQFVKRYPSRDLLLSQQALHELHGIALLADVDISTIECRHAAIRHLLVTSSRGSWDEAFQLLSADFLCRQMAAQLAELAESTGVLLQEREKHGVQSLKARRSKEKSMRGIAKKRRGGGGAQRAFFRARLKAASPQLRANRTKLFKDISREFANLTQREKQEYEDFGAFGALSHRAGAAGFGSYDAVQPRSATLADDAIVLTTTDLVQQTREEQRVLAARQKSSETTAHHQLMQYVAADQKSKEICSMLPVSLPHEKYVSAADAFPSVAWYYGAAEIAQAAARYRR